MADKNKGACGRQRATKMKALLVPFAVFYLIARGVDAFSIGCSTPRATCGNRRCSSIQQQQRQSAKKQKPTFRSATRMYGRPKVVSDEEYDERKEKLRQLLCLDQKSVDQLVDKYPPVLKLDIDGNVVPKSEMLQRKLGIDQKGAGQILYCPGANRLIGMNQEALEERIDYLQSELGLSKKQLVKLVVACSALLTVSLKNHYDPLFNSLQTSFGFTREEIAELAMKNPQLLQRASGEKIESAAWLLPQVLGLDVQDKEGLKKYIWRATSLLHTSESSLNKSYEWLLNLLGGSKSVAGRVCRNKPQLLVGFSIELLQNKVDWYQKKLSLTSDEFREVVAHYPNIFMPSIEDGKMDNKIAHLQQIFELNNEEFKEFFLSRPEIVALSAEDNIEPKLELYGSLIGKERARKLVVESPNLLLGSMKTLINPRLKEVDKAYEYVEWTETLLRRLVTRQPKHWCAYMLDDAPRGRKGEKLDDSGKYKRRDK